MADQNDNRTNEEKELRPSEQIGLNSHFRSENYSEETAAEIAAPVTLDRNRDRDEEDRVEGAGEEAGGRAIGFAGLALSIISLFVLPVLFGAAGIVLGFIARRQGANSLGAWAIGIGVISIIVGIFILPFF